MAACRQAGCRIFRRENRPDGEAAAQRLRHRHDVRRDTGPFVTEQFARAPEAGLNLVIDQEHAGLVAQFPQSAQADMRYGAHAALTLDRFDHDRSRLRRHRRAHRLVIPEGNLVEPLCLGPETFQILGLATRSDGAEGAPVKGAGEGEDAIALGLALQIMIAPRHLDGGLIGLRTGIAEHHLIGETVIREALRETLALRNFEEIRDVPELFRLRLQRLDESGVGMAQIVDGNAGTEVEISLPASRHEPGSFASFEGERHAGVVRDEGRIHGTVPSG